MDFVGTEFLAAFQLTHHHPVVFAPIVEALQRPQQEPGERYS